MYRKTYAKINNNILKNNVQEIITKYPDYQYYIGVVKNNAYNHGIKVVNSLIEGGINYLAVSSLEEALSIRQENKKIPILILEPISIEFISLAISNQITITIESLSYLEDLLKQNISSLLKVHFKIDSGMNRLGFKDKQELNKAYKQINSCDNLVLEGIYTHFATNGRYDKQYDNQIAKLKYLLSDIDLNNIPIVHFDRSLTFVSHHKIKETNAIRLGIIMYGFSGSILPDMSFKGKLRALKRKLYLKKHNISPTISSNDLNLKTAFSLYSTVMSLRSVKANEVVGYNTYQVKEDGYIATIPIGYADGVTTKFKYVSINQKRYEIISDTMDMLMVLVDNSVQLNDIVEIFGENISIKEVTNRLNTNAYHLFNQISTRVVRLHIIEDEEKEIKY